MKAFENLPIKNKLILIFLLIALFTLALSCSIFVYNDYQLLKKNIIRNLTVLAGAVGSNSRAAIYFNDNETASNILSSLEQEPQIQYAALLDENGKIFATYTRSDRDTLLPPSIREEGHLFHNGAIELLRNIDLKGKEVGRIYLNADLEELKNQLKSYILLVVLALIATLGLAFILSLKLQSVISEPILDLAKTTNIVSTDTDYSIRVNHSSRDEIGVLYTGFNEMLSQIEKREKQLEDYRDHLENMVDERTRELSKSNEKLVKEVNWRTQIEADLLKSLKEKEVLLKEIHHRVKNNLQIISSLLRLHSYSVPESDNQVFKECSNRVHSMSLLYEKIYEVPNLEEIDFKQYLHELVSGLTIMYGVDPNLIKINVHINDISLKINSIIPCALITQELISNSLKHAFPGGRSGELNVVLRHQEHNSDIVELVVSDNGVGLPQGFDIFQTETIGLKLVTILAEKQLQGKITYSTDSTEGNSEFIIAFSEKEKSYDRDAREISKDARETSNINR